LRRGGGRPGALSQDDARLCRVRQFRPQLAGDRAHGHRRPRQLLLHGLALRGGREAAAARSRYAGRARRGADRHGRIRNGHGRRPADPAPLMSDPAATARALRQTVDVRTLEMLVCPLTKTRLVLADDGTELISVAARLAFPIRDGVPMLALDEAREVDPDELQTRLPRLAGAQEEEG